MILSGLNHHGELHGGLFHFDRGLRIFVQRAVDDIGPMHQFGNRCRVEAKALLGDGGDEAGAGLEIRIVELAGALILFEMSGVLR